VTGAKLVVPTAYGLDEITQARAILAAIERRHEQAIGADEYTSFKAALQRITPAAAVSLFQQPAKAR
jgi:hypothetical protein